MLLLDQDPHNNIGRQCNVMKKNMYGIQFMVKRWIKNPYPIGGSHLYVLVSLDRRYRTLAAITDMTNLY